VRLVVDSSVAIASVQPAEEAYTDTRDFMARLRRARTAGEVEVFAPPELWLEIHVVEQRLARSRKSAGGAPPGEILRGLDVQLVVPDGAEAITAFLEHLTLRMRGRRPFANATDLVYLWAAWSVSATVVTHDQGLLAYHQVVCDVTAPQHLLLPRQPGRRSPR
jgi:hypothetical protein